ncbi:MAG: hypothetical protein ACR2F1_06690 [Nitrososphaeraceae archaeon]
MVTRFSVAVAVSRQMIRFGYFVVWLDSFAVLLDSFAVLLEVRGRQ